MTTAVRTGQVAEEAVQGCARGVADLPPELVVLLIDRMGGCARSMLDNLMRSGAVTDEDLRRALVGDALSVRMEAHLRSVFLDLAQPVLRPVPGGEFELGPTDGTCTFADCSEDVFKLTDGLLLRRDMIAPTEETLRGRVVCHEIVRDVPFRRLVESVALDPAVVLFTPHQIRDCLLDPERKKHIAKSNWAPNLFMCRFANGHSALVDVRYDGHHPHTPDINVGYHDPATCDSVACAHDQGRVFVFVPDKSEQDAQRPRSGEQGDDVD